MAGRAALLVEWDDGSEPLLDDDAIFTRLRTATLEEGRTVTDEGDVDLAFPAEGPGIEAEYRLPYLAHATMEDRHPIASRD